MLESLEFKGTYGSSGPEGLVWPWSSTFGQYGLVGLLGSNVAQPIIMSATAGTPAATTPASLTAPRCLPTPRQDISLLFNSKLRSVPLSLTVLPTDSSELVWFTTT